jgi:hypothetical protein
VPELGGLVEWDIKCYRVVDACDDVAWSRNLFLVCCQCDGLGGCEMGIDAPSGNGVGLVRLCGPFKIRHVQFPIQRNGQEECYPEERYYCRSILDLSWWLDDQIDTSKDPLTEPPSDVSMIPASPRSFCFGDVSKFTKQARLDRTLPLHVGWHGSEWIWLPDLMHRQQGRIDEIPT